LSSSQRARYAARFSRSDFVQCLVHFRHDVKTIENVKRFGAFLANDRQVGFPHVGADELNLRCQFVADDGEKSPKGFDGSRGPPKAGG
jgi:hypothetical protein